MARSPLPARTRGPAIPLASTAELALPARRTLVLRVALAVVLLVLVLLVVLGVLMRRREPDAAELERRRRSAEDRLRDAAGRRERREQRERDRADW